MKLLDILDGYKLSNNIAMINGEEKLTYRQLCKMSDNLAFFIKTTCKEDKTPIIVYGHKNPLMLVAFLACVKSGRAYVPVDISVPDNRVDAIIESVKPKLIITTEKLVRKAQYQYIDIAREEVNSCENEMITPADYVKETDVYYIIFTSGSTGIPKGVQITYGALNRFVEWALTLDGGQAEGQCFINQAPFSFDLSVMDLYMSLASGSCLFSLEKETQMDYQKLFASLKESNANVWVSTPSFADLCLADPSFSENLLPGLVRFLFCGEVLTNYTATNLIKRFPKAKVYNTYGPTESTVAVTEVVVTEELLEKYNPLPVGRAKPGTSIKIMEGDTEVSEGQKGEIIIIGNTVSKGYFNNEKESRRSFFEYQEGDTKIPAYRTGDKGFFIGELLFYCGRIDLQIKLHGYRMEIEDVERNLMKVSRVEKAVVVPVSRDGKVKYLKAYCIYNKPVESPLKEQKIIKEEMSHFVPDYMIPKKIKFVDEIPMTSNGKADRKRIQEMD